MRLWGVLVRSKHEQMIGRRALVGVSRAPNESRKSKAAAPLRDAILLASRSTYIIA